MKNSKKQFQRRTKIIATLGPATDDSKILEQLISSGVDAIRLNFSHGTSDDQRKRVELVRSISKKYDCDVGILGDLQGPKIRITRFIEGKIKLASGDNFTIDTALDAEKGTQSSVGCTYKELTKNVGVGEQLLIDDGRIVLEIKKIDKTKIITNVITGGILHDTKGLNKKGGISAPSLAKKDFQDIALAAELQVDYLAISYPINAKDINHARDLLRKEGGDAAIISKIERSEAIHNIDEIIEASDAIMIARGDLGVEIGDAELPAVQKNLIKKAREKNCVVITATQMMESMITNTIPTRAEVFDVANAVIDGTDAVMLSGETAVGDYPIQAFKAMSRICASSEKQLPARDADQHQFEHFEKTDQAIASTVMYLANHLHVKAIVALTESGSTALVMSRINSEIPIFAMTTHPKTLRKVTLFRGVYPAKIESITTNHAQVNKDAIDVLVTHKVVKKGDLVIITKGDLAGVHGGTNSLKIVKVGYLVDPQEKLQLPE